jgi:MFS family permease
MSAHDHQVGPIDVESHGAPLAAEAGSAAPKPPAPEAALLNGPLQSGRADTGLSSSKPYSAFRLRTKWMIVCIGGLTAVFSPIRCVRAFSPCPIPFSHPSSSNIFVPAIPTLTAAFHTTEEHISLAVTVYLVFQAITPSFFGALSDTYGRRPVYVGTLSIYIGANIGLARALQATGGSAVVAIGAGAVADVAEPRERGLFMSVFQVGAMVGPAFGPLLGGVWTATLGWRAIFWFLTIATAVALVPLIM